MAVKIIDAHFQVESEALEFVSDGELGFHAEAITPEGAPYVALPLEGLPKGTYVATMYVEVKIT